MTLEQLRALDAVVIYGSVRAASAQLYKTAPAISALIKNLETDVNIQILSRDSYRPKLTQAGEVFYEKARKVLNEAEQLKALSQRISGNSELLINIAINAICPMHPILNTLKQIEQNHPNTQINVSSEHMGGAIERLKHGEADLAITTTMNFDSRLMEASHLMDVTIIPVAHHSYPLSQMEMMIPRHEVRKYTQVIVSDSSRHDEKLSLDVVEDGKRCHVTDIPSKKEIIQAGLGWGGLPQYVVQDELDSGELVALNVEGYPPRISPICLIRRGHDHAGPVAQEIWENLKLQLNDV